MKNIYTRAAFLLALTASAVGASVVHATTLKDGYVVAGATELRPLAVEEVNGQMHLQFPARAATDLPLPFSLGDDGRLSLVNFTEVEAAGGKEYVLSHPVAALILKSGDREVVVQRAGNVVNTTDAETTADVSASASMTAQQQDRATPKKACALNGLLAADSDGSGQLLYCKDHTWRVHHTAS